MAACNESCFGTTDHNYKVCHFQFYRSRRDEACFLKTERNIMMNGANIQKNALMWIALFVFMAAGIGTYAQQSDQDAVVTFHVA